MEYSHYTCTFEFPHVPVFIIIALQTLWILNTYEVPVLPLLLTLV